METYHVQPGYTVTHKGLVYLPGESLVLSAHEAKSEMERGAIATHKKQIKALPGEGAKP